MWDIDAKKQVASHFSEAKDAVYGLTCSSAECHDGQLISCSQFWTAA